MEYLLKIGLLMTLLPVILIRILVWCEVKALRPFKVTVLILLAGISLLIIWLTIYIITF